MDQRLQDRLNQIPDKIVSSEFLSGQGLGNEINFWIFDYSPESELQVRDYIHFLEGVLAKKFSYLRVVNINLLASLFDYLSERNFIEKSIEMQKSKGDDALLKALKGPLDMGKFVPYLIKKYMVAEKDLVLMTGIGSVWPFLRGHTLLNNLHAYLGDKPVVMFYPGNYSGQDLTLFGRIPSKNYYRAFKLVP